MTSRKLAAGSAFPAISLPVLGGGSRELARPAEGFDWTLVVVYRGKHCPLCTRYLWELNEALPDLNELGVDVVTVSADSEARATAQMAEVAPVMSDNRLGRCRQRCWPLSPAGGRA